jgi:DNA-directed RNA polymerase subunit beta'
VPRGKHLRVHRGVRVRVGEPLTEGPLVPQEILRINGEEAAQQYLLREIQNVYRSQDVRIDDKHIEVIVSQMMRKVRVNNPGDTTFLPGSVVDKFLFRAQNEKARKQKAKPATAAPQLMGITKAALQSESFISAASFQETPKVLAEEALAGKEDRLRGLKENVILGHLIPAGTAYPAHRLAGVEKKALADSAAAVLPGGPDDEDEEAEEEAEKAPKAKSKK